MRQSYKTVLLWVVLIVMFVSFYQFFNHNGTEIQEKGFSDYLAQIEELCASVAVIDRGRVAQQGVISELTGQGERIRIAFAAPLPEKALGLLEALAVVGQVRVDGKNDVLEVRLKGAPAEEAIPQVLLTALQAGVRVLSVSRGQRLEERVLEIT